MKPTHRTQPYRGGHGPLGQAMAAMQAGRTAHGGNPMDARRRAAKGHTRRKKRHGTLAQAIAARSGQRPAPPARGGIPTGRMTSGGQ